MSQAFGFSCKGGLNTNLNSIEILGNPGFAKVLENFGRPRWRLRRINGLAMAVRLWPNSSNAILGMAAYGDGVIVCSGTDIFLVTTAQVGYK